MISTQTKQEFDKGLPRLSTGKLFEHLNELCRLGTIWPGSREEILARDYFLKQFMDVGLQNVHVEDFKYRHYMPISSHLEVISPSMIHLTCAPLEYSRTGEVEENIIYVGAGSKDEFAELEKSGADFNGKVVLTKTNWSYFAYPEAEKRGAAGVIIVTDAPNRLIRYNSARMGLRKEESMAEYGGKIPGVIITIEDADILWSLLSLGEVRVRLSQKGEYSLKTSWNVIGSIPGSDLRSQKVVIGAHYDTQLAGGAWDNAVGGAGLIELARVMSPLNPRRTIIFCAFGCEEIGLLGSSAYTLKHSNDMKNYLAYVNLDSTSAEIAPTHQLFVTPNVRDFALQTIKEDMGWRVDKLVDITPNEFFCDYVGFLLNGVDIIWASEQGNPFFHTKGDTIDTINPEKLNRTTTVNGQCLFKLAYIDNPPTKHHGT